MESFWLILWKAVVSRVGDDSNWHDPSHLLAPVNTRCKTAGRQVGKGVGEDQPLYTNPNYPHSPTLNHLLLIQHPPTACLL